MKNLFLSLIVFLMSVVNATAQSCGYCHGRGLVKTQNSVSSFGINNEKIRCSRCKQLIYKYEEHWDPCSTCGGSGQGRQRSRGENSAGEDIYMKYLNPGEYASFMNCLQVAMRGTYEPVTCDKCNGRGTCALCNGSGYMPQQLQHPDDLALGFGPTMCSMCGRTGHCLACHGNKVVYKYTENGKAEARKQLIYYRDLVYSRMKWLHLITGIKLVLFCFGNTRFY